MNTLDEAALRALVQECLGSRCMAARGQILYSGIDRLTEGRFYFLGFNPAADGTGKPLSETPLWMTQWSAYTDQCWHCGALAACDRHRRRPHQTRVLGVMKELSIDPQRVFATNLLFVESKTASEVDLEAFLPSHWRVHQRLLAIVRPQYIVCLGNGEQRSVFSLLRQLAENRPTTIVEGPFKKFQGSFIVGPHDLVSATVVGVPHPSWPMKAEGLRSFVYGREGRSVRLPDA